MEDYTIPPDGWAVKLIALFKYDALCVFIDSNQDAGEYDVINVYTASSFSRLRTFTPKHEESAAQYYGTAIDILSRLVAILLSLSFLVRVLICRLL